MARNRCGSANMKKKRKKFFFIAGFMLSEEEYVSFECGYRGDDRAGAVTAAVDLLHQQWEQA